MQHILASRRLVLTNGAVQDVEVTRKEWARPDGVVVVNPGGEVKPDDQSFDFAGWSKLLELNLAEIENFGPNPALIGQGIENKSGRAIALLQQAGIAELGPYILSYKGWKLRLYRAVWMAVQRHWQGERWIRVTDDEQVAQFIQINGMGVDPNTGMPAIVNAVGSIDVDIIIDESPDYVNMQADAYDTLTALAGQGSQVPPDILIELSPLTYSVKQKIKERLQQAAQQPNPAVLAKQVELQAKQAEMQMKQADNQAQLQIKQQEAQGNMALKAAEAEQNASIKQAELAASIELKRQEAQAEIMLEREKAAAGIMLEREKAAAHVELQQHKHQSDMAMKMVDRESSVMAEVAKPSPPDHTKDLLRIIGKLAVKKTPSGMRRTKDGMQLIFDDENEIED